MCAYTRLLQEKILCDVDTLTGIIVNNTRQIIPYYVQINPAQCRGNILVYFCFARSSHWNTYNLSVQFPFNR